MQAFGFLGRFFGGERHNRVLQIFTPAAAAGRGAFAKVALAGVTVTGLAVAGAVAVASLTALFLALGAIYFLLTQVLGIQLDLDPRAFVERAQQYSAGVRN